MARHVMTPARRAALRKAQLASARKRRRRTNVAMYDQYKRRQRASRWQRRGTTALNVAKIAGGTALAGYGVYKFLTPAHRNLVDQKVGVVGHKIRSKVR